MAIKQERVCERNPIHRLFDGEPVLKSEVIVWAREKKYASAKTLSELDLMIKNGGVVAQLGFPDCSFDFSRVRDTASYPGEVQWWYTRKDKPCQTVQAENVRVGRASLRPMLVHSMDWRK